MSPWRRRRHAPDTTLRNPAWTPAEGQRIDTYYRPRIATWEREQDTLREDYTAEQWQRFQTWIRLLDRGLSLRRLLFARWRVRARVTTADDVCQIARRVWVEKGFGDG